jgi:hypothetical protein
MSARVGSVKVGCLGGSVVHPPASPKTVALLELCGKVAVLVRRQFIQLL